MKIVKDFIAAVLVIAIFAGVGYLGWSLFMTPGGNTVAAKIFAKVKPQTEKQSTTQQQTEITKSATTESTSGHGGTTAGMEMAGSAESKKETLDVQYTINNASTKNSERLTQALAVFNQALEQITVDPYVSATIITPKQNMAAPAAAPATLTINPSGNTTINVPSSGAQPQQMTQDSTNTNFVFDQSKLQQLNGAIFTLSQGIEDLNRLNEEFSAQAAKMEKNPADYETYLVRYNTFYANKSRLISAMTKLTQAGTIINLNPYASAEGYKIDVNVMKKIHDGVFKLAKANSGLLRLNEELTVQMNEAYAKVQEFADASTKAAAEAANKAAMLEAQKQQLEYAKTMEEYNKTQAQTQTEQQKKSISTTIVYLLIILFVIGLIAGIIGALISLIFPKKKKEELHIEEEGV